MSLAAATVFVIACHASSLPPPTDDWTAGTHTHAVVVHADTREYLLHVPAARPRTRLRAAAAFPLLIVMHGSGADGETVRTQSGMDRLADSLHFLVAYPNGATGLFGLGSDWNAGTCCGSPARAHVDDVGFITDLVNDVARRLPVDRRRIYVAGFSDGARMAYRVGCESAPVIAAIGVVSGSIMTETCAAARAVPLIAFHGTSDTEVPYDDSVVAPTARPWLAASSALPPSVRFWAAANQCQRLTVRRDTPHVVRAQFGPCAGADVLFFSVDSGAHAWPGGQKDGADGFQPTTELNASEAMVTFFLRHTLR